MPLPVRIPRVKTVRDTVLFIAGLGFAINEVVIRDGPERPVTLAFIAALLGLPFILRADEKREER